MGESKEQQVDDSFPWVIVPEQRFKCPAARKRGVVDFEQL